MSGAVLVGDIGGTNVRYALASRDDGHIRLDAFWKAPGDQFDTFDQALEAYLEHAPERPQGALFALAGPVRAGVGRLTNRPAWSAISADALRSRFTFDRIELANDFAAMARGALEIPATSHEPILHGERDPDAPIVVIGPGTGLGLALLLPEGLDDWRVVPSEGGHAAYAPLGDRERRLAALLESEYGTVSNEMVVSGAGLDAMWKAVLTLHDRPFEPIAAQGILDLASSGDAAALEFCRLRAQAIMAAAADAALIANAHGGVVLAGGVAARLATYLREPACEARFRSDGARAQHLANIPVTLATSEEIPLLGAAALYFSAESEST